MSNSNTDQTFISFGAGVRLMAEDYYIEAMGNGVTKRGFRALCRNLMVPMIEIGNTRYVDMLRFEIAMTAILRIGEDDFFTPGCKSSAQNRIPKRGKTKLDPEKVLENYELIASELLAAKRVNGVELTRAVQQSTRAAAEKMRDMAFQLAPSRAQKRRAKDLKL
jgi:hypothetical protein|tara:strand:+ start:77 stop:568 length:492 start_codon:yes stop_codon:yes gene_type:complete